MMNDSSDQRFFQALYRDFSSPLTKIDCGLKCGPYNAYGVPVCCDIQLTIPAAFEEEWDFLKARTDLWRPWSSSGDQVSPEQDELQDGQVLLQCLGYEKCQRPYRTLTCRAFPFYPYLDSRGGFIGLAYYRDYEESCWILSNLDLVSAQFRTEFRQAYQRIFGRYKDAADLFQQYAGHIRGEAAERGETLVVLDFDNGVCLVDPVSERLMAVDYQELESFGVFEIGKELQFPDEAAD